MNKVAGIGIAVVVIAVVIVVSMSFSNDSLPPGTTVTQVGPFSVESSQEITEEKTPDGTNHSILLIERIGIKP